MIRKRVVTPCIVTPFNFSGLMKSRLDGDLVKSFHKSRLAIKMLLAI